MRRLRSFSFYIFVKPDNRSYPDTVHCCIYLIVHLVISVFELICFFGYVRLSICPRTPRAGENIDGGVLHRSIGTNLPAFIVAGANYEVSLSPTPVIASAGSNPAFIV
jgi:hypothetical protein